MAKLAFKVASTSRLVRVFIQDSSQSDGRGLTGLAFGSSGLTAYYIKDGQATATQITLATMTVGTWATGGFKEVDATNMPGVYEIGLPDAALSTGKNVVVMLKGATNMVVVILEIELEAVDNQDTVRLGLTALPNVAAGANGGLPIGDASGRTTVGSIASGAIDATAIATDAIGSNELAASAVAKIQTSVTAGAVASVTGNVGGNVTGSVGSVVGAVGSVTAAVTITAASVQAVWDALTSALTTVGSIGKRLADDIDAVLSTRASSSALATAQTAITDLQSRTPSALVSGRMESSVGAMAANTLTASALATDAVTEIQAAVQAGSVASVVGAVGSVAAGGITAASIATDAIDADALAADAVTEIATGVWASGTRTLTSLTALAGSIASAVLDAVAASFNTAGTIGNKINLAGSAGDPWSTALPGSYSAGQAGKIVGDNVNATISSRSSHSAADVWAVGTRALTDKAGFALSTAGVDAILDDQVGDSTITMREAMRVLIAGMAGKLNGAATTTVTIRNLADSANVIVATVDADGNRSAVTVTP